MKSTLSIILCFTSIITCFSQKILSEHRITFSDENTSNYMIGLQEQKSGIKIASYSSLPYKGAGITIWAKSKLSLTSY
jgi:hypothetical protein